MVGSSKILTVSYGTFSCTLEGFDDSFETMKAIAEYFRDLAADDRYFGAEPATPDADMLARIAEREIARRVQAHEERGRIVLRAEDSAQNLTAAAGAAAMAAPEEAPASDPEGIETEISAAEAAPVHDAADQAEAAAPAAMQDVAEAVAAESDIGAMSEPEMEAAPEPPVRDDSLAAKLSLIRSVVSETTTETGGEFSEDEHAQDFIDAPTEHRDAATAADDSAAWFQADDAQAVAAQEPGTTEAGAGAADAFAVDDDFEDEFEDDFEDTLAELMADAMIETDRKPAAPERLVVAERIAIVETADSDSYDEDEQCENDILDEDFRPRPNRLIPETETALSRDLADVDADLRLEFDDLPEDEAEPEAVQDRATQDYEQDHETETGADAPLGGRERLQQAEDTGDLMRFFEEADSQLDAPASSQRRNAIQHLRAAVAATRAERKAGSELHRNVDDAPYRSDLASVVRPRRPQVTVDGGRSLRPEEPRPAPLKLVAEQRIDMPRPPIRPRRISGAALRAEIEQVQPDSGFSTFAEELGLTRLPDLLEAAAAYLTDVEGRPQFSRPMLMGKLREVEAEDYSREEGLRSFGQLLRTGKLQKLSGGRFAVTEETEFRRPGKRQVG